MAFNTSVFKTRALTALIFVVVMLCGLLFNAYTFFILISIIHFGAWWEYFNLLDKIYNTTTPLYTKIGFSFIGFVLLLLSSDEVFQLHHLNLLGNGSLFFSLSGFLLAVLGILKMKEIRVSYFLAACIGFLYLSVSSALLIQLSSASYFTSLTMDQWLPYGILLPGFVIGCMWINDTMAYIVGSFIGKTPLSIISPKKTWEGTLGGVVLCGIVVGLIMYKVDNDYYFSMPLYAWMFLAAAAAILGTIGDLVESKLKRMANVKDSGNFMPGHGGFLDRFDSLLFATPFMWLLFQIMLNYSN